MYEDSNDSNLDISSDACFYRYSTFTKNKLDELIKNLSKKGNKFPELIMYAKHFLLFYTYNSKCKRKSYSFYRLHHNG